VNYLPVNLVIIFFFLHPLLVGLIAATVGLERLTMTKVACLCVAMGGLVLAVGLSLDGLDMRGIVLALGSAVTLALVIVGNARAMREAPTIPVLFHMMLGAAAVLVLPLASMHALSLPGTTAGWTGLLGVAVAATFGTIAFFTGMARIGAVRAAMISNLEPFLGIILAVALLDEQVGWQQAAGLMLVAGAIFAMEQARAAPGPQSARGQNSAAAKAPRYSADNSARGADAVPRRTASPPKRPTSATGTPAAAPAASSAGTSAGAQATR
jgi:drug/metabolite transporter (DMT)-like permease